MVSNPATGIWAEGEVWSLVEELRIGAFDGEPEYIFGRVVWVDVGENGDIYVLDQQAQAVRVFNLEGTFIRQIGRAGAGPGEFGQNTSMIAVVRGDTLLVADPPRGIHRFDPNGAYVSTTPFLNPASSNTLTWHVSGGGLIGMHLRRWHNFAAPGSLSEEDHWEPIISFDETLSLIDTLLLLPVVPGRLPERQGNGCGLTFFEREVVWDISQDFLLHVGYTDTYRVMTYHDSRLQRVITKRQSPVPLSSSEAELLREAMETRWVRNNVAPNEIARMSARICFPDVLPPLASIRAGPEGTLWVAATRFPSTMRADDRISKRAWQTPPGDEWDIYDSEGRFLGTVTLPAHFLPITFHEESIYGASYDDMDIPYVVRLRITKPGAS